MDRRESAEYALRIATARDDLADYQRHLDTTREEIAAAQRTIEDLSIDACTQRVRMKELELDEEIVKKSEDEAIMDKIVSQKRLVEIGGVESAVRALQKALDDARRELLATREETQCVMSEERKMQTELVNLSAILQRTRTNSVKLQEEYSSVMREKRESDARLQQLCLFLQTDAPLSPIGSDTSPPSILRLTNGVEVAMPEVRF